MLSEFSPFIDIDIHPHVFKEYDLQIKEISKVKSVMKVESQLGTYALKKSKISTAQFNRMYEIITFLAEKKYPVPEILPNKYGDLHISLTDGIVYLRKWIDGENLTLNNKDYLLASTSLLGQMHNLGLFFNKKDLNYRHIDEITIRKTWSVSVEWLKRYRTKLETKENKTTFERIILSYIPFIHEWAINALEELNNWIIEYSSISKIRKTVCHGKFHHRNIILLPNSKKFLIDFDNVSLDTPVRDLAFFIRNYIMNNEYRDWIEEWVVNYQSIMPLLLSEKKLLSIFLLFPERIISLAKSYNSRERNMVEEIYLKKLQVRWTQTRELVWFVDRQGWLFE